MNFFNRLPSVLTQEVSAFLRDTEAAAFARTSRSCHSSLNYLQAVLPMALRRQSRFIQHVVHGEYELMQAMLNKLPLQHMLYLLCKRTRVTDNVGREFEFISAFEYALWALDKHMWIDMLKSLPRDEAGHLTGEGLAIVVEFQRQYVRVKTQGVTYKINGEVKTESHYDFTIIKELQKQVMAQSADGVKDWDAIYAQWREGVGGAQRLFPMHVMDEYCSNTPFHPVPQFVYRAIPANGRKFYNRLSNEWESWFAEDSKLGVHVAIYKAPREWRNGGAGASVAVDRERAAVDLAAIMALREIRKSDFVQLGKQLDALLVVENQPPRLGL